MGEQQVEAAAPLRCVEQLASGRALCGLGSVCGGAFWATAAYRLKAGVVSAARRQEERERTHAPRHHHGQNLTWQLAPGVKKSGVFSIPPPLAAWFTQ